MNIDSNHGLNVEANLEAAGGVRVGRKLTEHYVVECFDKDGVLKWVDEFDNLVVTAGLNDSIDKHFKGSTYTAAWYVGLTTGTPSFAAGDTMASHAGWTEYANYSQAARPALTLGSVSGGSANNSASKASYTINGGGGTVGGAFVVTDNTKSGSSGTLYGGGAFTEGNRAVVDGDTLNVTVTVSATAA